MATDEEERADRLFQALSDRTRRDILWRVMREEHSVSTLAQLYPMSFAAVQRHVAVLEKAGLVIKRRNGREQLVRGEPNAVRDVATMLAEFEAAWRGRIGRIEELLTDPHDSQGD